MMKAASTLRLMAAMFRDHDSTYSTNYLERDTQEEYSNALRDYNTWFDDYNKAHSLEISDEATRVIGGFIEALEQKVYEEGLKQGFAMAAELMSGASDPLLPRIEYTKKRGADMFKDIPDELKELKQWVLWIRIPRGNKDAKIPLSINGYSARTNDSRTWCSFEDVVMAYEAEPERYSGIGFVFSADDPYCGIDLDHCINGGQIEPWAQDILAKLKSYAEYSPSGTGVHILAKGKKPTDKCRRGTLEIYEHGRYFTVTGDKINAEQIEDVQAALEEICAALERGEGLCT